MDDFGQEDFPNQGTQALEREPNHPQPYLPAPQPRQQAQPAAQQQAPQAPPQIGPALTSMLPWGMADQLDLQRHLAGLTQVEQDHSAGNLSDEDAQSAAGAIMPRLQTLLQKQQQAQAQKMQQGVQAAMQGAALEEGVNAVHKQSRAGSFGKEIASLVDPVSGHRAYFTQDHKGDWSEVQFDHAHTEDDFLHQQNSMEGQEGGDSMGPFSQARGDQTADGSAPAIAAADPQQMKQQAAASGQPMNYQQFGRALDPSTFEQTIHSGQHTDRYRGGQLIGSDRPTRGGALGGGKVDHEAQLKAVYQVAERSVPPLRPGAGPHEALKRQEMVQQAAHSLQFRLGMQEEHQRKEQSAMTEHQRQEQARVNEHQRIESSKKEERLRQEALAKEERKFGKPLSDLDRIHLYNDKLESLQKQHKDWQANLLNEGKEMPAEINPKNHESLAEGHVQKSLQLAQKWRGGEPGGGGAGGGDNPRPLPTKQDKDAGDDIKKIISTASAPAAGKPADHEQVRRLLPVAQNALRDAKAVQWKGAPLENLQALHDILDRAHQEGRPLTGAETRQYSLHHQELDTTLKNHQVANGAEWLKLDAKPPVKPAETKATAAEAGPDRSKISKANQEHVSWLEWAARTSSSGEARRKIARAAEAVKRAVQYQKMDQDRDLPAYEEGLKLAEAQHERNAAEAVRTRSRLAFDDKSRYQKYQGE